jgi:methionyl-tRNA formyltransferase
VMLINEGLDSGDILSQEEEPIYEKDNTCKWMLTDRMWHH